MRLLEEHKNKIIKLKVGNQLVTFDTNTTPESDYPIYHRIGFDFCFEVEPPTYLEPKRYMGIDQEVKSVGKVVKPKNGKKNKAKTQEG